MSYEMLLISLSKFTKRNTLQIVSINEKELLMSIEFIFARRSIRTYTTKPVSPEMIRKLLEAGMAAPSANNRQPWHFVVVTDRTILSDLAQLHPYGKMLAHAQIGIAICGDPSVSDAYWQQDCAAATQNVLLAASTMGLGAVWLGCYPRQDRVTQIGNRLGIPPEYPVLCLISIGYPAEHKEPRHQYDASKVHRDQW